MTWVAIVLGAAVGAPLRYAVERAVTQRTAHVGGVGRFPWGLLVVNVSGSMVAGVVLALTTGDLRTLLLTGFCGAFTTFSGFAWEANRLLGVARGTFWWAMAALPVGCVAGFLLAWRIGTAVSG